MTNIYIPVRILNTMGCPLNIPQFNPINSDLNTLCVNAALRFKCPTKSVHCIKIKFIQKNLKK
jgi:hypothetical protein